MVIDLWDGNATQVQAFEAGAGLSQPVLMNGRTSGVAHSFAATLDHFFVVGGDGIIRYQYARVDGFPAWRPADVRLAVDAALADLVPLSSRTWGAVKGLYH